MAITAALPTVPLLPPEPRRDPVQAKCADSALWQLDDTDVREMTLFACAPKGHRTRRTVVRAETDDGR